MTRFIEDEDPVSDLIDDEEPTLYFSDWRKENGYKCKSDVVCIMSADGASEEEIDNAWEAITEEFWFYCAENDFDGDYDE